MAWYYCHRHLTVNNNKRTSINNYNTHCKHSPALWCSLQFESLSSKHISLHTFQNVIFPIKCLVYRVEAKLDPASYFQDFTILRSSDTGIETTCHIRNTFSTCNTSPYKIRVPHYCGSYLIVITSKHLNDRIIYKSAPITVNIQSHSKLLYNTRNFFEKSFVAENMNTILHRFREATLLRWNRSILL